MRQLIQQSGAASNYKDFSNCVSIMTFNILAQCYTRSEVLLAHTHTNCLSLLSPSLSSLPFTQLGEYEGKVVLDTRVQTHTYTITHALHTAVFPLC